MKLLIVEDHEESAQALCRLLSSRMEYLECKFASNLEDGLKAAKEFNADITLLDLNLPGTTVADVIHTIPEFPPPVIVVSDMNDAHTVVECFRYKAQNVLPKHILRSRIDSIEGRIEADKLIRAITDAHFRNILPRTVNGQGT